MDNYDFSGWATRNDLKCSDGRVIKQNAFKDDDGQIRPLVWNHQHNDPMNVLGHALLENREEGVYAYCKFNDTENGRNAKLLVEHGDVSALSIFANQLQQQGPNVIHGAIREVSLVLAGANPGAFIDSIIKHGETSDEEAIIYTGEEISLYHAESEANTNTSTKTKEDDKDTEETKDKDDDEETVADVFNTLTEKQKNVVYAMIGKALSSKDDDAEETKDKDDDEETVADVFNTLTEKQKNVVYAMIGEALSSKDDDAEETKDDDTKEETTEGGKEEMKHNVFEPNAEDQENTLSHDAMTTIIGDAKRFGSMKESLLQHADTYGIQQIDWLFPDAKNQNVPPEFIKRDTTWVQKVMGSVHHTPFSRVKSTFADITEDDARAKGYMKGNLKKEEVFSLLKRTTSPTTVYKKQKMDRDDIVDITDFDVVSWLKSEMRMMLDEELARAYLIGDGRLASSDDKINEANIRPIAKDEALFTIQAEVGVTSSATADDLAKTFIRTAIKARKDYKGSGSPVMFTTEDMLTDMLLLEDAIGHALYADEAALARKLRVREIVTVPVMEGVKGKNGGDLLGIIVNLNDYNVGADRGGAINMFDDFDIDYNQQKYLIETRCSGALIKPYSAIALEKKVNA